MQPDRRCCANRSRPCAVGSAGRRRGVRRRSSEVSEVIRNRIALSDHLVGDDRHDACEDRRVEAAPLLLAARIDPFLELLLQLRNALVVRDLRS